MKCRTIVILVAAMTGAFPVRAQKADPFSAEIKQVYDRVRNNLIKMAQKMPEENYSFKPTPETRTFARIVAHVADLQARACSAINYAPKSLNAAKAQKTELIAMLEESFSLCDQAFGSLDGDHCGRRRPVFPSSRKIWLCCATGCCGPDERRTPER